MIRFRGRRFRCEIELTTRIIAGKWKSDLVWHLREGGAVRFNELKRLTPGISQRILAQQLRELERDGVVAREVFPEVPPRVEYRLTPSGRGLAEVFAVMIRWAERHVAAHGEPATEPRASCDAGFGAVPPSR